MRVCIVYMLHAEELLDIRADGFSANILMAKDDRQYELQDHSDITKYVDVFEAFGRAITSKRSRSYDRG